MTRAPVKVRRLRPISNRYAVWVVDYHDGDHTPAREFRRTWREAFDWAHSLQATRMRIHTRSAHPSCACEWCIDLDRWSLEQRRRAS